MNVLCTKKNLKEDEIVYIGILLENIKSKKRFITTFYDLKNTQTHLHQGVFGNSGNLNNNSSDRNLIKCQLKR